jgi:hypothetical protein
MALMTIELYKKQDFFLFWADPFQKHLQVSQSFSDKGRQTAPPGLFNFIYEFVISDQF